MLDNWPEGVGAPSVTSFGRLFYWPPQLAGLERAEMNRRPLRTSGYGIFRTSRDVRLESAMRTEADIRRRIDAALATASTEVKWRNGISLAGTFEGEFSNVTRSYAGKGVARYQW
jgi:hypothetical protein